MRTYVLAAVLCALSATVSAEKLPPVPLPLSPAQIADLPREDSAWEHKWKSHHDFIVVRIVTRGDRESGRGFSVIEIRHQTVDFSELALVLPGHEPNVDDRVLIKRMQLKTFDDTGPFLTFIREPDL